MNLYLVVFGVLALGGMASMVALFWRFATVMERAHARALASDRILSPAADPEREPAPPLAEETELDRFRAEQRRYREMEEYQSGGDQGLDAIGGMLNV